MWRMCIRSFSSHKKTWTEEALTLVFSSPATHMNSINLQHVKVVSPATVAAGPRWHVIQAAGTECPEQDVKWNDLQNKISSTKHSISVLFKYEFRGHFVPRQQQLDTHIPKDKKLWGWFSDVMEHSVHLRLNGVFLCFTLREQQSHWVLPDTGQWEDKLHKMIKKNRENKKEHAECIKVDAWLCVFCLVTVCEMQRVLLPPAGETAWLTCDQRQQNVLYWQVRWKQRLYFRSEGKQNWFFKLILWENVGKEKWNVHTAMRLWQKENT